MYSVKIDFGIPQKIHISAKEFLLFSGCKFVYFVLCVHRSMHNSINNSALNTNHNSLAGFRHAQNTLVQLMNSVIHQTFKAI